PALARAPRRENLGTPSNFGVEVEKEDDPEPIPALEIAERVLEVVPGEELDRAARLTRRGRLPRGAHAIGERRARDADGREGDRREHANRLAYRARHTHGKP